MRATMLGGTGAFSFLLARGSSRITSPPVEVHHEKHRGATVLHSSGLRGSFDADNWPANHSRPS